MAGGAATGIQAVNIIEQLVAVAGHRQDRQRAAFRIAVPIYVTVPFAAPGVMRLDPGVRTGIFIGIRVAPNAFLHAGIGDGLGFRELLGFVFSLPVAISAGPVSAIPCADPCPVDFHFLLVRDGIGPCRADVRDFLEILASVRHVGIGRHSDAHFAGRAVIIFREQHVDCRVGSALERLDLAASHRA